MFAACVPEIVAGSIGSEKVMTIAVLGATSVEPFDGKRMIFGGFAPIFDERA